MKALVILKNSTVTKGSNHLVVTQTAALWVLCPYKSLYFYSSKSSCHRHIKIISTVVILLLTDTFFRSWTVAEIVALNGKLITDPDLILLDGNLKYQKNNYHKARQAVCHKKSIMIQDLSSVVIAKEYEKQNNVEKYQCFCLLLRLIIY